MASVERLMESAILQNNPLRKLLAFLDQEEVNKQAKNYGAMRFVGYVLEIGYSKAKIITSDPYKAAVGGLPRNSLLIMVPDDYKKYKAHFALIRVLDSAPHPLTQEVQQAYFDLQKKSMPEIDVFTEAELQWGALETSVIGMFYENPDKLDKVEFSGDLNNFVSAHRYRVFSPTDELLHLIVNALVPEGPSRFPLGNLRLTECRLPLPDKKLPNVTAYLSTLDLMGTRTAMFGKTRLGKSNIVKLIATSLIQTTRTTRNVGQLIFDPEGEYANNNPKDNSRSIASANPDVCAVYALTQKPSTPSKPLKLNFYEHPEASHRILRDLLALDRRDAIYVQSFNTVELPRIEDIGSLPHNEQLRARRRILMYWAILKKAGYDADEARLARINPLDPRYHAAFRQNAYQTVLNRTPPALADLDDVVGEFEVIADFIRNLSDNDPLLASSNGNPLFQRDERALLGFLRPSAGAGPSMIHRYTKYHDRNASNFTTEIISLLEAGKTVIIDLGNADPQVMDYFSYDLTNSVFKHQVDKFSNDKLGNHYVQLYFEEAHNLFPKDQKDPTNIYKRVAKEGAKFNIGMIYSTQSVTTIDPDLLNQTENFFIAHLPSRLEVVALSRLNTAYEGIEEDILNSKTVGYVRMLTRSHRFVIPVQARKFEPVPPGPAVTTSPPPPISQ